jgi:FkbM family methyltransferase
LSGTSTEESYPLFDFPVFNRQKTCRYGQMLYNINDKYIGPSLDLYGEFSEGEVELFRQIVKPGNVVVEVGANIGAHTVFLARQVAPGGMVLAFEPQRVIHQTLCANMALNSLPNVFCMQAAVGAEHGVLKVPPLDYTRETNFGGVALGNYQVGEQVPLVTLDSYTLPACHLIKVDVEGMEEDALRGAVGLINRYRPTLYVENDRDDKSEGLIRFIDSLGYRMYWHRPLYFNPDNFMCNPNNIFSNVISINMLCIPQEFPQDLAGFEPVLTGRSPHTSSSPSP